MASQAQLSLLVGAWCHRDPMQIERRLFRLSLPCAKSFGPGSVLQEAREEATNRLQG